MSLGKVAIFAAGAVIGGLIGYASTKSDALRKATRATIKAGVKTQKWAAEQYDKAKKEVKSLAASDKKELAEKESA